MGEPQILSCHLQHSSVASRLYPDMSLGTWDAFSHLETHLCSHLVESTVLQGEEGCINPRWPFSLFSQQSLRIVAVGICRHLELPETSVPVVASSAGFSVEQARSHQKFQTASSSPSTRRFQTPSSASPPGASAAIQPLSVC